MVFIAANRSGNVSRTGTPIAAYIHRPSFLLSLSFFLLFLISDRSIESLCNSPSRWTVSLVARLFLWFEVAAGVILAVTIRRNRKRCSTLTRILNVVTFVTFEFSSWFRGHWSSSYLTDRSRSTVPFIQLHGAAYENLRYVWSHLARSSCAERYRDLIHHFSRAGGSKDRDIHAVSAAREIALRFENLRFHSCYLSRITIHALRVRVYKVSKYSCLYLVDAHDTLLRNLK